MAGIHVALFDLDPSEGLTKRRLLLGNPAPLAVAAATGSDATWFFNASLPLGNYAAVAFEPSADSDWISFDPDRRQVLGIYRGADGCAASAFSHSVCYKMLSVAANSSLSVSIRASSPAMMPTVNASVEHGRLLRSSRARVSILHVRGTAYDRGFAHGRLLARQIIDMLEYFLLEDMVRSYSTYSKHFLPSLHRLAQLSDQFIAGARGMLAGMVASNESLRIPSLDRDVGLYDLVALNTYSDAAAWTATASTPAVSARSSCSQFVFWGDATPDGETIAGRNMDGENDIRKLTVNNLVLHVIEPAETQLRRFVHVMWPGFLGVSSGVNDRGRYLMENAGCNPPGAAAAHSPLRRDLIGQLLLTANASDLAPSDAEASILSHRSADGGSCPNGCIMVFAGPHVASSNHPAGFVYEGDRFGGAMRLPSEASPRTPHGVMATNHYLRYQYNATQPNVCNGGTASFSSLARYFTGSNRIEALGRAGRLLVDSAQMKTLLQSVAHGTTEHSIVVRPNAMTIELAVATSNGLWDAPYEAFAEFKFEELFR